MSTTFHWWRQLIYNYSSRLMLIVVSIDQLPLSSELYHDLRDFYNYLQEIMRTYRKKWESTFAFIVWGKHFNQMCLSHICGCANGKESRYIRVVISKLPTSYISKSEDGKKSSFITVWAQIVSTLYRSYSLKHFEPSNSFIESAF